MIYQSDSQRAVDVAPHRGVVLLTIFVAVLFNLFPYPDAWFVFKPDFVALALTFWVLRPLGTTGYATAFTFGVVMDVAYTVPLGQHAFAYAVLLLVANLLRKLYSFSGMLQQGVIVFVLLSVAQISSFSVSMLRENATATPELVYPPMVGAALWFVLPLLLLTAHERASTTA